MSYLNHVRERIRLTTFPQVILDALGKLGILIQPFYLVREGLSGHRISHFETGFDEYELSFLGPEDMKEISAIPYRGFSELDLLHRLKEGMICLGAKHRGNIAAFTWCDLEKCQYEGYPFRLKESEAYLFDAYTSIFFRGRGLAPFLRYQLYKELYKSGRTTLYSISERYNLASIRFKKKVNAKLVAQGWYVRLFGKWHFSSSLKHRADI